MYLHHPSPVRSVIFTPDTSHPLYVAVGLENGSICRWDLKQHRRGLLNRIPVAHAGAILALDWWQGSSPDLEPDSMPVGHLASSGLDQTVNIWKFPKQSSTHSYSSSSISTEPIYALHPSFPVRQALFRPGPNHATELVLYSNTNDGPGSGSVEIWDVRRPWIAKWSIQSGVTDSNQTVVDAVFPDSDGQVLWTLSYGGTFARSLLPTSSDTCDALRPLDAIPTERGGLGVWNMHDEMSVFLGTGQRGDKHIPYEAR
jgi:WD repeat-containing protein 24